MLPRTLSDYLTRVDVAPNQPAFGFIDPRTRFGWVVGEDGEPERIEGPRIEVPLHDWPDDGESLMAKCLVRAAEANPLKVASYEGFREAHFWQKVPNPRVLLAHPSTKGRFYNPGLRVLLYETVPKNRIVVLRPPQLTGYYFKQGTLRGILAHNSQGLILIEVLFPK